METLLIYIFKSCGLMAMFYIAYMLLLRKETFFTTNRWFLLSGLLTSILLPLFFIKKIILVEAPKVNLEELTSYSATTISTLKEAPVVETFDWVQFTWISYISIALLLVLKIVFSFFSLYKLLHKEQVIKKENFKLINLNKNIAPFSFFNYVVVNPNLYTEVELQSILLHEKIHSQQKHSIDVFITKLFCIVFWFNPIIWLYKKAILQNLEYIADQKATQQLEDKKSYQMALLKAVTHQNCLSITNNFYQSLIKKRIVMLNTNQSHKRNSWKYALIIPMLLGFVFLFQVKVIAQEKKVKVLYKEIANDDKASVVITKKTTDTELKRKAKKLKENHDIKLKYSKVKRNSDGEITGIKLEYKDKDGNKGVSQINGNEPIAPIQFYKTNNKIGFNKPSTFQIKKSPKIVILNNDDIKVHSPEMPAVMADIDFDLSDNPETVKELKKHIIIGNEDEPMVIVNGKVLSNEKKLKKLYSQSGKRGSYSFSFSSDNDGENNIIIDDEDVMHITNDALEKAMVEIKRVKPEIKAKIKAGMAKAKSEISKVKVEIAHQQSKIDREKQRAEIMKTKAEIDKVREEIERTKEEIEKEKSKLKK